MLLGHNVHYCCRVVKVTACAAAVPPLNNSHSSSSSSSSNCTERTARNIVSTIQHCVTAGITHIVSIYDISAPFRSLELPTIGGKHEKIRRSILCRHIMRPSTYDITAQPNSNTGHICAPGNADLGFSTPFYFRNRRL